MKKQLTKEDKKRFDELSQLGCAICQMPCQIHHVLLHKGLSRKNDNSQTFGLCEKHHTGKEGIHTIGRKTWEARFGAEMEILDRTNRLLKEQEERSKLF